MEQTMFPESCPNSSRRVAFLGTSGGVSFARLGFDEALRQAGMNTGNMIFQYASWEAIDGPKICINSSSEPTWVRQNADVLFIPAANQVNPAWDLAHWAEFIEAVDLPVSVVGLGAQAPLGHTTDIQLQKGTIRFLEVLSERCKSIGVRGEYTANVLQRKGINNISITGCPSNFINAKVSGSSIQSKIDAINLGDIDSSCYVFGTMESESRPAEIRLSAISRAENSDVVYQTNPKILRGINDGKFSDDAIQYLDWESAILWPEARLCCYANHVAKKGKFYSDARAWIDEAGRYSIVYGMRIHGTIAAIQGGGLGVCVAFDSRTEELAQTMGYPYVLASTITNSSRIRLTDIAKSVKFTAGEFDKKRLFLMSNYKEVLHSAGISTSSSLH